MNNYSFAVINKVPKVGEGNEYDQILVEGWDETNENVCYYLPKEDETYSMVDTKYVEAKLPVFHLSEILILDQNGREVTGMMRKPSKWSVEFKEFNTLDKAIEYSKELEVP